MRLRRLDLTRYGKFTGQHIDFGERADGQPDLHLVYGPNEAGKSTALSAFLDLLFGIEPRSKYNFLHAYQAMQIGATLEIAGATHTLRRIKRPQNSLLDSNDQVVSEQLILAQLAGIDRDSYRARFSLDDDTLEAGGENILASRGDLGELLFAATAGLADLSQKLTTLREEADRFFKPHARSTDLADKKAKIAKLKQEREALDTVASKYAALTDARDRTKLLYETEMSARTTIRSRMDEIQRFLAALPRLVAWRTLRDRLAPLADLPEAPAAWSDQREKLEKEQHELSVLLEAADRDIAERTAEHDAITLDEPALALAARIDGWTDARARAITAGKDIPERQMEVRKEDLAIAAILGRLGHAGHPDPRALIPTASIVGTLRALMEKRSGIESTCAAATRELAKSTGLLDEAKQALAQFQASSATPDATPDSLENLAAATTSLQTGSHAARLHHAERSLAACREETVGWASAHQTHAAQTPHQNEILAPPAALSPWHGDLEQLAALVVPDPSRIEQWKAASALWQKKLDQHESDAGRFAQERAVLQAELASIAETAGLVTDPEAASIRAAREHAWSLHRGTLTPASADDFEAALRRDDIVTNARLRHEAEIIKLHTRRQSLAAAAARETLAEEGVKAAQAALQTLQQEFTAAITSISPTLAPITTPAQLDSWLAKRNEALQARARLKQAERDLRDARADQQAAHDRLATALAAAGIPPDVHADSETLLALAQAALRRAADSKSLTTALLQCERDAKTRERDYEEAASAEAHWQKSWAQACKTTLLESLGPTPEIATVREILDTVAKLGPALDSRALLIDRIEKMHHDEQLFACHIAAAADALDMDAGDTPPLHLDREITRRVQAARTARELKTKKHQELEQARKNRAELHQRAEIHARQKVLMTTHFAVDSLTEVATKLRALETRTDLRRQAEQAERDIIDALRTPSIAEAERQLDSADRTALESEHADLSARHEIHDNQVQTLYAEYRAAEAQILAVGGDAAVAKIEEQRRTILLEIEEGARRYLKLRLGIAAAAAALRAYRKHHRSAMMARASEAFQTISQNAYAGLASQPNRENEVLVALCADGSSKIAPELSKGTRFQLYLALRVAGYHEFATYRDPLPFIADDIMETFDDFRAEATLRVFTDMSRTGQVIYLTHHRHLCEIAQATCPQIRLHTLQP